MSVIAFFSALLGIMWVEVHAIAPCLPEAWVNIPDNSGIAGWIFLADVFLAIFVAYKADGAFDRLFG